MTAVIKGVNTSLCQTGSSRQSRIFENPGHQLIWLMELSGPTDLGHLFVLWVSSELHRDIYIDVFDGQVGYPEDGDQSTQRALEVFYTNSAIGGRKTE